MRSMIKQCRKMYQKVKNEKYVVRVCACICVSQSLKHSCDFLVFALVNRCNVFFLLQIFDWSKIGKFWRAQLDNISFIIFYVA